jgi:hypothetical protein
VHWSGYDITVLDIEVDPQCCRFGSRKPDFALQALVECRALEPERVPIHTVWDTGTVCVCLLLQDLVQSCLHGGGGIWEDMCYERRREKGSARGSVHWSGHDTTSLDIEVGTVGHCS